VKQGRPLVLIVDDDRWMRQVLKEVLSVEDFLVAEASRITDAVRILKAIKPNAVVLDLALPGDSSGLDLLWTCNDTSVAHDVPVIVVSAYADLLPQEAFARAVRALQKPVDLDELVCVLKAVVSTRSSGRSTDHEDGRPQADVHRRDWLDAAATMSVDTRLGDLWSGGRTVEACRELQLAKLMRTKLRQ